MEEVDSDICVQDKKCGMDEKPGFFLNGRLLSRQKKSRVSLFAHFFVLYKALTYLNAVEC